MGRERKSSRVTACALFMKNQVGRLCSLRGVFLLSERKQNGSVFYLHIKSLNPIFAITAGFDNLARIETNAPVMERTSDRRPADNAIGERPAAMRAAVLHRHK